MLPAEGEKRQLNILRQKSGEEHLKTTFGLNRLVNKIMEAGVRHQFPHSSPEEFKKQVSLRTKSD